MEEDERLLPILSNVARQHSLAAEYDGSGNKAGDISADDVDKLAQHFPLCMRHLHARVTEDHHLKHGGRMQYGLFLKAIGLSLEEALLYWKRVFQPRINDEKFAKNYAYNIRHNYGQEGKRTNYSSYSCAKIITTNHPGQGDHHGCPFRHFNADNLRATLRASQVPELNIQEVLELVKNQHYQVACTRYYEVTHKVPQGQIDLIQHPNSYFDMSMGKTPTQNAKELDQKYTFAKENDTGAAAASASPLKGKPAAAAAAPFAAPGPVGPTKEKEKEVKPPTEDQSFDAMLEGDVPDF